MKQFYIYILASKKDGTLYIGVTSNLQKRIYEHRLKCIDGFSRRYGVDRLVYFEPADTAESAIIREKQIKKWKRNWKIDLIEKNNPDWRDLYGDIAI